MYITEVNKIHQADIMYLPHDKYYLLTYKYVLNVVDLASRYKASRPLRTKKASVKLLTDSEISIEKDL